MINWRIKKKVQDMHVAPGDTIRVKYTSKEGRYEEIDHLIDTAGVYNTLAVGELKDEWGFEEGLVGVIGKSSE